MPTGKAATIALIVRALHPATSQSGGQIMRTIRYLLLASAISLLKFEASLAQELSAEDRACILSAVAKLPTIPGLKVEGRRVLPQSQAPQGRRSPALYNVLVAIEVSILGESETYVFNCIRNSQATVIQPMGRSPGSLAKTLSVEDQACITSAVAKVPNNPAIKIERSRVLPQSRAQGRHKPDLYNVLVEIDVSLIGQSSTYVFNCVHDGQLTVVQLMSIR